MASGEPKAKVIIGADTSEFTRGIKQSKADLKSFGNVSDDVLGKLGAALGIDTKQVEQMASAIRGMGQKLGDAGKEGDAAFKTLASGVSKLGAGIAALGIAGLVAGFKALNAEAENFKSTIAGANIELQTRAYIDTYKQAMHDMYAEVGKGAAEAQSKWQKFWTTLPTRLAAKTGNIGGTATGFAVAGGLTQEQLQLQQQINQAQQEALGKAERAEQIAGRLYELERLQSDASREVSDLDKRIAENREIMRDAQYDLNERLAAYRAILDGIAAKSQIQLSIEEERTKLMDEMVGLTNSTPAAIDAANQQYVKQQSLSKQLTDEKAALLRYANSLFSQEEKITDAMRAQAEYARQIAQSRASLKDLNLGVSGGLTTGATTAGVGLNVPVIDTTAFQGQLNAAFGDKLFLEVGIKIDKKAEFDLTSQVESIVSGLAESMSSAIGGLVGDLMTGGDAWGNFTNAALSAMGDMATAVGKIAIECGVASLGIKAALTNLGPAGAAMAIAAGTALVALGAAVKAGLSNVVSGNYSAGANVASNASAYTGGDYETRDVQVHVSGQLKADGDQLVAVIENTNTRNGYTT